MSVSELRSFLARNCGVILLGSGILLLAQRTAVAVGDQLPAMGSWTSLLGMLASSLGVGLPFFVLPFVHDHLRGDSPELRKGGVVLAVLSPLMLVSFVGTTLLVVGVRTALGVGTGTTGAKLVFGSIAVGVLLPLTAYGLRLFRRLNVAQPRGTAAILSGGAWVWICVAGVLQATADGSIIRSIPGFPFLWTLPFPLALSMAVFGAAFLRQDGRRRLAGVPLLALAATWVTVLAWNVMHGMMPAWLPFVEIQAGALLVLGATLAVASNPVTRRESDSTSGQDGPTATRRPVRVALVVLTVVGLVLSSSLAVGLTETRIEEEALETALYQELNEERQAQGLDPLNRSAALDRVAQAHSDYLSRSESSERDQSNGSSITDRYRRHGIDCTSGYNTAGVSSTDGFESADELASRLVDRWARFPDENDLNLEAWDRVGIDANVSAEGGGGTDVSVTIIFCDDT